jgi:cysteine-rich repeat protein
MVKMPQIRYTGYNMTHTSSIVRIVTAVTATFALTFSAGYGTSLAMIRSEEAGAALGAAILRPAASPNASASSSSRKTIKSKKKVRYHKGVKIQNIIRPRRETGAVVPVVRSSKASGPIKATCGDKRVIAALGEDCDDGNTANGDGCSSACKQEAGFSCAGYPSTCAARCGDGVVTAVEKCDDGNAENGDGCSSVCKTEYRYTCTGTPSTCEITPYCGDGVKASTEACDDGNSAPGDGCFECKAE